MTALSQRRQYTCGSADVARHSYLGSSRTFRKRGRTARWPVSDTDEGENDFLAGEPTNWRVFPRSEDYVNQLHVVYEDHLDIFAFTHDYFVSDQASKMAGFSMGEGDAEGD